MVQEWIQKVEKEREGLKEDSSHLQSAISWSSRANKAEARSTSGCLVAIMYATSAILLFCEKNDDIDDNDDGDENDDDDDDDGNN